MTATFCGHREIEDSERVRAWLTETVTELIGQGAELFYIGDCGAFDRMAAGVVHALKAGYPQIRSVLVLAYLDRPADLRLFDSSIFPPLEKVPLRFAISRRNRWMVGASDCVVACVQYGWGGAAQTLDYAVRRKKQIIRYAD